MPALCKDTGQTKPGPSGCCACGSGTGHAHEDYEAPPHQHTTRWGGLGLGVAHVARTCSLCCASCDMRSFRGGCAPVPSSCSEHKAPPPRGGPTLRSPARDQAGQTPYQEAGVTCPRLGVSLREQAGLGPGGPALEARQPRLQSLRGVGGGAEGREEEGGGSAASRAGALRLVWTYPPCRAAGALAVCRCAFCLV
jgi:hypothetical protein